MEKNISTEIGIDSFNMEQLSVKKVNTHNPKDEVHAHFKQLQDIINSY